MKKLILTTTGADAQIEVTNKKKYENSHSYKRNDAIMTYIQAGVAVVAALIVCTGIYFSN